jgi:hypothetical protein
MIRRIDWNPFLTIMLISALWCAAMFSPHSVSAQYPPNRHPNLTAASERLRQANALLREANQQIATAQGDHECLVPGPTGPCGVAREAVDRAGPLLTKAYQELSVAASVGANPQPTPSPTRKSSGGRGNLNN